MNGQVTITAVPGIPDIAKGDDLGAIIGNCLIEAGLEPQAGDIYCIAQKVFSKAEGCIIPLAEVDPSEEARRYARDLNKDPRKVEVVLRESTEVVRAFKHESQTQGTMICRHRLGFISANAAVDESNFEETDAVMTLPHDPDASCAHITHVLQQRFGCAVGVVMTDTFGRPWRVGQVNVAIGLSAVPATNSEHGNEDAWGRPMSVTQPAFADELAAASGLVMGKTAKTPVVLFRGLDWMPVESSAQELLREKKEDMFK